MRHYTNRRVPLPYLYHSRGTKRIVSVAGCRLRHSNSWLYDYKFVTDRYVCFMLICLFDTL